MNLLDYKKELIKNKIKPLFKDKGFTVSGNHWRKKENGFIKIFNLQSSQFNSSNKISFYINIGIFFPNSYPLKFTNSFYGGIIPDIEKIIKTPSVDNCQFNKRGSEILKYSTDYSLDKTTAILSFEELLLSDISNRYLPIFDQLNSVENCSIFIKRFYNKPLLEYEIAIAFAHIGKHDKAKEILNKKLKNKTHSKIFLDTLKLLLEKTNLNYNISVFEKENKIVNMDLKKGFYP